MSDNSKEFNELIEKASKVYSENWPNTTCFERAVFFSWACKLEECCKYCYMSTLPPEKRTNEKVRSFESILAETVLCNVCGWDYGFLSGGIGMFDQEKILDLVKKTVTIMDTKIWVSLGAMDKELVAALKPHVKGIVGTVEVINPKLHDEICPSKPLSNVEKMFDYCTELGVDKSLTLIVGLGETIDDVELLKEFIAKYDVKKIHIYALNAQKGTVFENTEPPTPEYQAEWIAKIRIAFPKLDIQCGIWKNKVNRVELLLQAGANSVSKYPILKEFGSVNSIELERQAELAGREFTGTVVKLPNVDWQEIVMNLPFDDELKEKIYLKLLIYLKQIKKTIKKAEKKKNEKKED